jgi:hypothetical protein
VILNRINAAHVVTWCRAFGAGWYVVSASGSKIDTS